jgi:Ca2+-binding RTX toxin-like protein
MAKIKLTLDDLPNLWTGTTANEQVTALGGNDTLDGGAGNDSLYGARATTT